MSGSSVENVIEIKDLTKQFQTKFGTLTAVDHISFQIRRGENFGGGVRLR